MKLIKIVNNPIMPLIYVTDKLGLIEYSDLFYLNNFYRFKFGKKLNIKNPVSFNEKLQWLKIYDRNDLYSIMVDKHEVKKYVSEIIGEEFIIPTVGVYNTFDEINFDKLPNQFVIKCTHNSGGVIICHDKANFNYKLAKKCISKNLKTNFYKYGREWPYKNVKPRIIIEKLLKDDTTNQINDYKFFCFNGKVKLFKVDFDRNTKHGANYYDLNCDLLPFGEEVCPPNFNKEIQIPSNIHSMIKKAELLAKNTKFVRIDFYNVNGKIYFGEITFYPASGFGKFIPNDWDEKLGNMLNLGGII